MSLVFIFSHPDDEAFGPAGTLAKFAENEDVYFICVTNGNDTTKQYSEEINKRGLVNVRKEELENSAKALGAKKVYFLEYEDGSLCNDLYHELADKIQKIITQLKPDKLMTFEPRGVSGHIDHIVVSMVTSFVFRKLKSIKKLYYYCLNREERDIVENYFIYFPPGYKPTDIDLAVDVAKYWDKKIKAIKSHKSQIDKEEDVLQWLASLPKKEHFLILER